MEKRVAIIGAGISGLLACKYALSKGFEPIVFEGQGQVGGVWVKTVECTRLQNTKDFYGFSDFPWPDSVKDMFPTSAEIMEYLDSYAKHFQLMPYIKLNSKVVSIDYVGESEDEMEAWELWGGSGKAFGSKGKWNLKVHHAEHDSIKEYVAEFVIVCSGRFSGLPNIPEFSPGYGPEVFSGEVLHSMDYASMDNEAAKKFVTGKKVAVVGSGKSAIDVAFECAKANGTEKPCTLVQRTVHWTFPTDAEKWGLIFGYMCFTRVFELMVHKPDEGFFLSVLATLLSPLRWIISKIVEFLLKRELPMEKYNMVPKASLVQENSSCQILFLPDNFYDKVEQGSLLLKKSQKFNFCKEGLILDGEVNPVKADLVIFGTGYKGDEKLRDLFVSPTFQKSIITSPNSIIPLYRQIILPRVPQLAILGYSESLSNLYTLEIRAQWLAHFLDQTFQLPSIKEMEKDVMKWEKFMKRYSGNGKFRRSCVGAASLWYNDQLCRDIGCNPRRKKGFCDTPDFYFLRSIKGHLDNYSFEVIIITPNYSA